VQPNEVKATSKFDEANKLQIDEGDVIIVIDGRYVSIWNSQSFQGETGVVYKVISDNLQKV